MSYHLDLEPTSKELVVNFTDMEVLYEGHLRLLKFLDENNTISNNERIELMNINLRILETISAIFRHLTIYQRNEWTLKQEEIFTKRVKNNKK